MKAPSFVNENTRMKLCLGIYIWIQENDMQVPSMFAMNLIYMVESIFRGWLCKKQLYEEILVSKTIRWSLLLTTYQVLKDKTQSNFVLIARN